MWGPSLPLSTTPLPVADSVSLVLAGEALVAVSQYVLVLDLPTLAKILDGAIQTCTGPCTAAGCCKLSKIPRKLFYGPFLD